MERQIKIIKETTTISGNHIGDSLGGANFGVKSATGPMKLGKIGYWISLSDSTLTALTNMVNWLNFFLSIHDVPTYHSGNCFLYDF